MPRRRACTRIRRSRFFGFAAVSAFLAGCAANTSTVPSLPAGGASGAARTARLSVIFRFGGSAGAYPLSGLIPDSEGNLYGTTPSGGAYVGGTVYELLRKRSATPSWTALVLHAFDGEVAAGPYGRLVMDAKGNLYGTSFRGGKFEYGLAFELQRLERFGGNAWRYIVLHNFKGGTDGNGPIAGLTFDSGGNLYGTTYLGGGCGGDGCGVAFELLRRRAGWAERVIHDFGKTRSDGVGPGDVTIDASGNLYGTAGGGGNGNGIAWKLSPPARAGRQWRETILHRFGQGNDGQNPNDVTFGADGSLYGATRHGGLASCAFLGDTCGTIYQLKPPLGNGKQWTESVLFEFPGGGALGDQPDAPLSIDATGSLYGTTEFGGEYGLCSYGCGVIFKLSRSGSGWTYTLLADLPGSGVDGRASTSGVYIGPHGHLFTTAELSTTTNDTGTALDVAPY